MKSKQTINETQFCRNTIYWTRSQQQLNAEDTQKMKIKIKKERRRNKKLEEKHARGLQESNEKKKQADIALTQLSENIKASRKLVPLTNFIHKNNTII